MQITINDIRHAVHAALGAAFPDITISSAVSNLPQAAPYLLVHLLEFTQTYELGHRYRRNFPFVIQYSAFEQGLDDKYEVAEQMIAALKELSIGDHVLSGKNLSIEMIEDELHLFVTYGMIVREQLPHSPNMKNFKGGIVIE